MVKRIVNGLFSVNTYLIIKGNECLIVDPGMDLDVLDIRNKYDVKGVLITHCHVDHIYGLKDLKDVPCYISMKDAIKLERSDLNLFKMLDMPIPFKKEDLNLIYVNDGDTLDLLDTKIKVMATPGHTDGSVCYLMDDILFSGDTLFASSIGRTDFPTGNILDMRVSLRKLFNLPNHIKVYPGHDEVTSIKREKENNPYYKKS